MRGQWLVAGMYAGGEAAVAGVVVMAISSGRPADHFTRDPLAMAGEPGYVGVLSNVTAGMWFATAGMWWLMAAVQWNSAGGARRWKASAAAGGVVTLLGLDDLLMIHEWLLQERLGIPEVVTFGMYGVLAAGAAARFREEFAGTPKRLAMVSAGFFAGSLLVDQLTDGWGWRLVLEDSLKLMGVVGLAGYTIVTGAGWLGPRQAAATGSEAT